MNTRKDCEKWNMLSHVSGFTISKCWKPFFLLLLGAVVIFVAGTSCKRIKKLSGAKTGGADKIVILSPHWEGIRKETERGFKAWYKEKYGKDIAIEWVEQGGGSTELVYIKDSFKKKPDGIGIDMFYGGGADRYMELAKSGLLAECKVPEQTLKQIPADINGVKLYDEKAGWYGVSLTSFGILENKAIVARQKLPAALSWKDLGRPELAGWVEIADPRKSSSAHAIVEILLQAYGWEDGWALLTRIAANARALPDSSSQVPRDTAMGQVAYGLTLVSYAYSHIEEYGADKLAFVMPSDVAAVTPDPIALLKGGPNPEAACAFVNYSLSPEGQKLWLLKKGAPGGPTEFSINTMAVMPSLYKKAAGKTMVDINPYELRNVFKYDTPKGAARLNIVDELFGALLIDTHAELAAAWKKNAAAPASLFAMPVTEAQAAQLTTGDWNDPVKRDKLIAEWKSFALNKYK